MNPRLRFWIIGLGGAALALVMAIQIANESYVLSTLVALGLLWLAAEHAGGPLPEAWLVAGALFGYVVGSRGFAQLSLSTRLPLLPAEAVLLVAATATVLRMALGQAVAMRRDGLNAAVLLWVALGAARLPSDWRTHGMVALRDFATVYYALFFFIAQALAAHAASARLLRRALLTAGVVLPVVYFLSAQFPDFFFGTFTVRGTPLFYYKEDLVAANFCTGFFLLLATPWPRRWVWPAAALCYVSAFAIASSRAAAVGLAVASAWWAVARRWEPWKLQALLVPIALVALALTAALSGEPWERSRLYQLYEHVTSITDVTGTRTYRSEERQFVGDNNRFRLAWWRSVAEETWAGGPVLGLGFGADLTERFVRSYKLDLGEEFVTRSPHSIVFTVLGRMGCAGLAAWLAVVAIMGLRTWRTARAARGTAAALPALGAWSAAWVLLVSGCFGVVLEGPMGAVVFWTLLGLANATPAMPAAGTHDTEKPAAALPAGAEAVSSERP